MDRWALRLRVALLLTNGRVLLLAPHRASFRRPPYEEGKGLRCSRRVFRSLGCNQSNRPSSRPYIPRFIHILPASVRNSPACFCSLDNWHRLMISEFGYRIGSARSDGGIDG